MSQSEIDDPPKDEEKVRMDGGKPEQGKTPKKRGRPKKAEATVGNGKETRSGNPEKINKKIGASKEEPKKKDQTQDRKEAEKPLKGKTPKSKKGTEGEAPGIEAPKTRGKKGEEPEETREEPQTGPPLEGPPPTTGQKATPEKPAPEKRPNPKQTSRKAGTIIRDWAGKTRAIWETKRKYLELGGLLIVGLAAAAYLFWPEHPEGRDTIRNLQSMSREPERLLHEEKDAERANILAKMEEAKKRLNPPPTAKESPAGTPPKIQPEKETPGSLPATNPVIQTTQTQAPPQDTQTSQKGQKGQIVLDSKTPEKDPGARLILATEKGTGALILVETRNPQLIKLLDARKIGPGTRVDLEVEDIDDPTIASAAKGLGAKPKKLKKIEVVK